MAYPTVIINNSTGSNTAASGAGPGTALTGVLGATNTNTTVNITDVVDLSGVAVDGSAVLWLKSASGLQFSQITAISGTSGAWVVTVATAYTATATGKTWAIGGKRATLDHADTRTLGIDWKAGWTVDIQQTGVDYTLTSVFTWTVPGTTNSPLIRNKIYSSSVTRPLITTATNSINLWSFTNSDYVTIQHISFSNTAGTKGSYGAGTGMGLCVQSGSCQGLGVIDCIIDGFVCGILGDNQVLWQFDTLDVIATEVKNCTDRAVSIKGAISANAGATIDHCYIHNNTGDGVRLTDGGGSVVITHSVIANNGGRGFYNSGAGASSRAKNIFLNNDFKANTSAGIETVVAQLDFHAANNIFVSNGDYAVKFSAAESTTLSYQPPQFINNAFYNNTTGTILNAAGDINSITLTGDPFISSSDFGLNATAGAGAACKAAALTALNASANTAGDIGAIPSGGGTTVIAGGPVSNNMCGGFIDG